MIVRERDSNWPIGVLGSLALVYVFAEAKLYAQVGLQVFYVVECQYGWWMWTRKDKTTGIKLIRIGKTGTQTAIWLTIIGVLGTAILYPIFKTTGEPPLLDRWVTSYRVLSLAATR